MASGQGQIVQTTDFNTFRQDFYNVFGTGSNNSGYGQPVTAISGAIGGLISSTVWSSLRLDMIKARQHQTGLTIGALGLQDGNNLVPITQSTIITDDIRAQYSNFSNLVVSNKDQVHVGQLTRTSLLSASRTTAWNLILNQTITFSAPATGDGTRNNFRYFFNTGGKLSFDFSRTGGTSSAKNTFWSNLLTSIGTLSFGSNGFERGAPSFGTIGAGGTISSISFYDLSLNNTQLFSITGSGADTGSYFKIYGRYQSDKLIITLVWNEPSTATTVTGSLNSVVSMHTASGVNVSVLPLTAADSGILGGVATPPAAVLTTSSIPASINEGDSLSITISYNDSTTSSINWLLVGSGTKPADSSDMTSVVNSGTLTLDSSKKTILTLQPYNDMITEGVEKFYIKFTNPAGDVLGNTSVITINDTSPYLITTDKTDYRNNDVINYTISTSDRGIGNTVYIGVTGDGVVNGIVPTTDITGYIPSPLDSKTFTTTSVTGSFTISPNAVMDGWSVPGTSLTYKVGYIYITDVSVSGTVLTKSPEFNIISPAASPVVVNATLSENLTTMVTAVNFSGSTVNTNNGVVLYAVITGKVTESITGSLTQPVTVNNNMISGHYDVNITAIDKPGVISIRIVPDNPATEVGRTELFTVKGHGTVLYNNTGTFSFVSQSTSVELTYPNEIGELITKTVPVVFGKSYNVGIGDFGVPSKFDNTLLQNTGVDKLIFSYYGKIDRTDYFTFNIHSVTGQSFTSTSGKQDDHVLAASNVGLTLLEDREKSSGDLKSTISIYPFKSEVMQYTPAVSVYLSEFKGRDGKSRFHFSVKPASSNNYQLSCSADDDPSSGNDNYRYSVSVKMVQFIKISW